MKHSLYHSLIPSAGAVTVPEIWGTWSPQFPIRDTIPVLGTVPGAAPVIGVGFALCFGCSLPGCGRVVAQLVGCYPGGAGPGSHGNTAARSDGCTWHQAQCNSCSPPHCGCGHRRSLYSPHLPGKGDLKQRPVLFSALLFFMKLTNKIYGRMSLLGVLVLNVCYSCLGKEAEIG